MLRRWNGAGCDYEWLEVLVVSCEQHLLNNYMCQEGKRFRVFVNFVVLKKCLMYLSPWKNEIGIYKN